jgi:hypothetical protein
MLCYCYALRSRYERRQQLITTITYLSHSLVNFTKPTTDELECWKYSRNTALRRSPWQQRINDDVTRRLLVSDGRAGTCRLVALYSGGRVASHPIVAHICCCNCCLLLADVRRRQSYIHTYIDLHLAPRSGRLIDRQQWRHVCRWCRRLWTICLSIQIPYNNSLHCRQWVGPVIVVVVPRVCLGPDHYFSGHKVWMHCRR